MENKLNINFINFLRFIFCLLPISLVFSIFIADLIVVFLIFTFLWISIKKNDFSYFNNKYFILFFIYWVYITLLSFFSENFLDSFKSSFTYIRFIILPLIVLYLININKKFIKYFFYSILITFCLLIFDSSYEFLNDVNIFGNKGIDQTRISSFFNDEYVLGSYLSKLFFLVASLWFFLFKNNNFKKNFIFGFFLISSFAITFLSGDRMPLLLFTLGLFLFLILSKFNLKLKFMIILSLMIFVILCLNFSQNLQDRIVKKTLREMGSIKGMIGIEGSRIYGIKIGDNKKTVFLSQHQNFFITAYKIFKENPVFGKGNKGFKYNCFKHKIDQNSCSSHPHNTYMQLLVENGIIGFLFFFIIFVWINFKFLTHFINILKKNQNKTLSNSELCLLICIYLNLWPIAQTGNFFNNWLSIIYFLPVGFLLNEFNLKNNINKS